ncbi:MAG: hypothetical protein EX285_08505 [Thaumarchaeota archaeon]|nr:hypothetical protein [Nitrososphaerota archaeon]
MASSYRTLRPSLIHVVYCRNQRNNLDEDVSLSKYVNKIREILGWDVIDLVKPKSIGVKESNEQPTKDLEGYGAWLRNKYVNSSG